MEYISGRAIEDVIKERRRQVEQEGWTPSHDDRLDKGQLAAAAACYTLVTTRWLSRLSVPHFWPFLPEWWKLKDRRRSLVCAAALLIAEIERLDRASEPPASGPAAAKGPE